MTSIRSCGKGAVERALTCDPAVEPADRIAFLGGGRPVEEPR
ncbi:hypothetical protein FB558_2064 [Pseudonocardia kunmingensis]|uniref:Uncharacterized protein n=1 Tax=Pseudonocardia kunmingensis TaxID=630975 RepID=A0A543E113_9PSEU|nr:hypothetical protein FB558_2064 [Pseudonocardia kunmingensis]